MSKKPKTKSFIKNSSRVSAIIDVLSVLASFGVAAAIAQHIDHVNQLNKHLMAFVLHTGPTSFSVNPDFQLNFIVPLAIILLLASIAVRRKLSTLTLISLVILATSGFMWLFGFRLVHIS